jgi:glycosyltransferase involved in cell wall biosynthesis
LRLLALFFHPTVYGKNPIGGVERRFLEVSKVMRRMRISVETLEFYPSLKRFLDAGYESYELERPFPRQLLDTVISALHVMKLGVGVHKVKKCQIVAITGHRYLSFTVICAYLLAKLLRIPWVIFSGGLLPREKMPLRNLFRERRKRGFTFLGALVHTVVDWLTKQLYAKATAFIVVSPSEKNDVTRFLGVPSPKIHVVGNGVNLKQIDSVMEKENRFDAAFMARVEPEKGLDILIRSWEMLMEQMPSAQLVVIGGGRLKYYRRLIEQKNLSANIHIVGFTSFEQAMALLKQSKMFLFPSKHESFPLSLLEAMACSLPCIVSDAFAETAIDLLRNDHKREGLGNKARAYAEMFSWTHVVTREIRMLTEILQ